jgi:hypothetical protein
MLFRRANGERIDANNSAKVVKVLQFNIYYPDLMLI